MSGNEMKSKHSQTFYKANLRTVADGTQIGYRVCLLPILSWRGKRCRWWVEIEFLGDLRGTGREGNQS